MKTNKMKLALLTLCVLVLMPQSASAYKVTDTDAVKLNDDTILFSITYSFGFLNRDMMTPIQATFGDALLGSRVSYEMSSANTPFVAPYAPAIVLSNDENVTIKDGQYYLPRGKNAEFTLIGLLRLKDTDPKNALQMAITNLPYTTIDGDTQALSAVLPDQLKKYVTPTLTLIGNNTISMDQTSIVVGTK